jgi:osmoprotectant transport system permease protein
MASVAPDPVASMAVTLLVSAGPALQAASEPSCYSRLRNEWVCTDYLVDRREEILSALGSHVVLTVSAVLLGLALALPLALVARRLPRLEATVTGTATGLYTIPSLALFPLLVPFTGLTATTVVIGLALYALSILVRALLDGLAAVPDDVREAARGLGYPPTRRLLRVELPLALPVLMAGVRVATVSTVALTTVGALVSHGGLGDLLVTGVSESFRAQVLTAAVLCVALAVTLDALLVLLQRALTPWVRA